MKSRHNGGLALGFILLVKSVRRFLTSSVLMKPAGYPQEKWSCPGLVDRLALAFSDSCWRAPCPYQISGLGNPNVKHAYGIDAFQALILAIDHIRRRLETFGRRIWGQA